MTIKQSKAPAIPSVPQAAPAELSMFLNAVKSAIDVMAGDSSASGVTLEQLDEILREYTLTGGAIYGGIVRPPDTGGGGLFPGTPPDTTTPPAPSGLITTGGVLTVILEWDVLPSTPPIAFTTVYRASVDNFSLAEPVGTTNVLIYADYVPDIDPYYYWIRFTSEAGVEGPINAAAGTVGAADPDATGKITVESLSALTANLGLLRAGSLRSPDETFIIDLTAKEILITGPNGRVADDYTLIRNGQIEAWFWTGSTHALAGALRGIQVGVANNGDTVTIPGYFRKQPNILVSPASVPSYLQANSSQDQTLQCAALNIVETVPGSGSWQFDAVAQLVLNTGTELQTPTLSFFDSQIDDQYLSSVTTSGSTVSRLQAGTSVRTYQSDGNAGVYFNRQVTVSLEYRPAPFTGAWTVGDTKVQQINQESSPVAINLDTGTIPENQYETRLRYVFVNTGGTYTGVGGGTRPATPVVPSGFNYDIPRSGDGLFIGSFDSGAWTPPPDATNIRTDYEYDYTATSTVEYQFIVGPNTSTVSGTAGGSKQQLSYAAIDASSPETNPKTVIETGTFTASLSGSYDQFFLGYEIVNSSQSDGSAFGRIQTTGLKATINYDEPIPTDTDPHNFATWDTLVAELETDIVISDGTVNWQAIGES